MNQCIITLHSRCCKTEYSFVRKEEYIHTTSCSPRNYETRVTSGRYPKRTSFLMLQPVLQHNTLSLVNSKPATETDPTGQPECRPTQHGATLHASKTFVLHPVQQPCSCQPMFMPAHVHSIVLSE